MPEMINEVSAEFDKPRETIRTPASESFEVPLRSHQYNCVLVQAFSGIDDKYGT